MGTFLASPKMRWILDWRTHALSFRVEVGSYNSPTKGSGLDILFPGHLNQVSYTSYEAYIVHSTWAGGEHFKYASVPVCSRTLTLNVPVFPNFRGCRISHDHLVSSPVATMAGLQTDVYVSAGITWISALIALILRVVARRITKQRWWIDDYFCLAAFAAACAYNTIMIKCE